MKWEYKYHVHELKDSIFFLCTGDFYFLINLKFLSYLKFDIANEKLFQFNFFN